MKTRMIYLTLNFFLLPLFVLSQQNYYRDLSIVKVGSEEYMVKYGDFSIQFDNTRNKEREKPRYKDGTPLPAGAQPIAKMINKDELKVILQEIFTIDEIIQLKNADRKVLVGYVMDSFGNVKEVGFSIPTLPEFYSIPPVRFSELEQGIKKRIKWDIDDRFKNVTHIPMSGFLVFDEL